MNQLNTHLDTFKTYHKNHVFINFELFLYISKETLNSCLPLLNASNSFVFYFRYIVGNSFLYCR